MQEPQQVAPTTQRKPLKRDAVLVVICTILADKCTSTSPNRRSRITSSNTSNGCDGVGLPLPRYKTRPKSSEGCGVWGVGVQSLPLPYSYYSSLGQILGTKSNPNILHGCYEPCAGKLNCHGLTRATDRRISASWRPRMVSKRL